MEGLPFALVNTVALILFKNLGFDNAEITLFTSLFTIPWFIKPLLAPIIETSITKHKLILLISSGFGFLVLLLAASLNWNYFFIASIGIFFALAFISSLFDMTVDGLYIAQLNRTQQAHFIGIRTVSYHIGRLIAQGGIVLLASLLFTRFGIKLSWQIAFICLALFVLLIALYHSWVLPVDQSPSFQSNSYLYHFKAVLAELHALPYFKHVVIFVLLYNFSENQLIKIIPLFLMDSTAHGGLEFSTAYIGMLIGTIGTISMLMGILFSGLLLAKISLSRYLLPVTILSGITNFGYLFISFYGIQSIYFITIIIIMTQFTFGLSNGAYMLYLLNSFSKGTYYMSLYAIGTALMGFSAMFGGAISGYLQSLFGYNEFFSWIIVCNATIIVYCYYLIKKGYCHA